jgi:3-deoxy-7-phosphoheptulonate synthase
VKVGPNADPLEVLELARTLNPLNEPGKLVLICRLGVKNVEQKLAPIISAVTRAERRVLWVVDPMHGNAIVSKHGVKTRNFDDILKEVELSMDVHRALGTTFGGVHFELTGEDVTECIGGGLGEDDLDRNYATLCDPRLNYRQAVEIAFAIARRFDDGPAPATVPPPPPPTSRR